MAKLIIEARINEYTMRDQNRHVPWTVSEIARTARDCARAGAAVIHFHARRPDGAPDFSYDTNRDIIRAIRSECDALVSLTLGAHALQNAGTDQRIEHVMRLAEDGFAPDFAPVDMGSTNADRINDDGSWFASEDRVYVNSIATLKHFVRRFRQAGIRPQFVHWNMAMLRSTQMFMAAGLVDPRAYVQLALGATNLSMPPPSAAGLATYLPFLPDFPLEWSVFCTGGSMLPLLSGILQAGGHVSLGLGDHGYRELGAPTNADVIAHVVELARQAEREPATPDEVRALLGLGG